MTKVIEADLCVIGGGSAGLSVAAGAAQMGARTVLIERARMGGDCLNTGCVPSKSLLAAAHRAAVADCAAFGIRLAPPVIDDRAVYGHVEAVIAGIAPHDSAERFERLGVTVLAAAARFTGATEVTAGAQRIQARRVVVATGSQPARPPVAGLAATPYLTNETIFSLGRLPSHLIILGGGPVGVEMAVAHRRLGARVSLVQRRTLLPRDDAELVAVVRARLVDEGVTLHEQATVRQVSGDGSGLAGGGEAAVRLVVADATGEQTLAGSHLLVATGRQPTTDGLALEEAGIVSLPDGIPVDRRLRTSNRRVFAIGDVVAGWPRHTHVAAYHAGVVLKNALFRLPVLADPGGLPRVTYTDPELAQVGLTEADAADAGRRCTVLRASFADNDRARSERRTEGLIKVVVGRRGRILGCGIVGAAAGELIQPWVLAMHRRLPIGALATMIAPYPTLGEISKRVAGCYYAPSLFGARSRWLVRQLARLG